MPGAASAVAECLRSGLKRPTALLSFIGRALSSRIPLPEQTGHSDRRKTPRLSSSDRTWGL